jgi:hypothetical protein
MSAPLKITKQSLVNGKNASEFLQGCGMNIYEATFVLQHLKRDELPTLKKTKGLQEVPSTHLSPDSRFKIGAADRAGRFSVV